MAQNDVEAKVKIVVDSKAFNAALKQANKEAKEFKRQQSSAFKGAGDDISKAFGNAIGAVTKLAPALSASAGALAVAKKAMQENQTITDEWGRITESARATWEGFVNSLVTADLGSFLSNMDEVVRKSRDAYDAMDALGTAKIFNSREMAKFSMDQEMYMSVLRNKSASEEDRNNAAAGLKKLFAQEDAWTRKMADYHFETFAKRFAQIMTSRGDNVDWQSIIHRNAQGDYELTANSAYDTYYRSLADYEAATARRNEMKQKMEQRQLELMGKGYNQMTAKKMTEREFPEFKMLNNAIEVSDEKMQELYNLLTGAYQGRAQYYRNVGRANRYLNGLSGAGGSGSRVGEVFAEGSIGWVEQEIAKANKEWKSVVTEGEKQAAQARLKVLQEELEVLKSGKISTDKLSPLGVESPYLSALNAYDSGVVYDPKMRINPIGKTAKEASKQTDKAIEGVKTLTSVISDLGITSHFVSPEVSKVTNIIGRVLTTIGGAVGGPWGWVLQGIGGIVGSFDTGGIIGGTSYKGDKLTAQVSSGEMILNKAQQRNLLAIAGGGGAPSVTAVEVRGDKMVLLINNTLRQQGKSTIG